MDLGEPPPPYFRPNWGPKGRKKNWDRPPPPRSQGLDEPPPRPYLKVGIRHFSILSCCTCAPLVLDSDRHCPLDWVILLVHKENKWRKCIKGNISINSYFFKEIDFYFRKSLWLLTFISDTHIYIFIPCKFIFVVFRFWIFKFLSFIFWTCINIFKLCN